MEQLDADTAFLNSDLKDRVYMEAPLGINNAQNYECHLNKAIYGLKQAASAWNKTINCVFLGNGFIVVKRTNTSMSSVPTATSFTSVVTSMI